MSCHLPEDDRPTQNIGLDGDSDYGSDWDDNGETILAILADDARLLQPKDDEHVLQHAAFVPLKHETAVTRSSLQVTTQTAVERRDIVHNDSPGKIRFERHDTNVNAEDDARSPLERFRTQPKKPLSVTDLVSPAWCELQYWYSLTKFGRKIRTPAMERGSSVHKNLEEQVHQMVPVDVQTREDHWGLRIWNVIQGLRMLRATGTTRELEVWGTVDGLVVNGVIDELSYTCSDPELEAALAKQESTSSQGPALPADQMTISEYFASQASINSTMQPSSQNKEQHQSRGKIYVTDVKTRNHHSLPKGPSLRPTQLQLMLYRKLLSHLACNEVDSQRIFERYRVDATATFSDSLIAQLSSLDYEFSSQQGPDGFGPIDSDSDALTELLVHNTLASLWGLMIREFQTTFEQGDASLSRVLRAEFRDAHSGTVIGSRTFVHGDAELDDYVADELAWWRGERPARGVEVEEAFKCRVCEHAEGCTWRIQKVDEAVQTSRQRRQRSSRSPR